MHAPKAIGFVVLATLLGLTACSSGGPSSSVCPVEPESSTRAWPGAGGAGGSLTEVASFGSNPGALKMYVHAPSTSSATAVIVALHGCTQSANDYVKAGWNELADRVGAVVVYPEQSTANNMNRCFNWFVDGDTARDQGEARSIASMTEHAKKTYGATKAFVTGLSAGGAMTAVMLATYPDLFDAGAVMAGIPYGCASSTTEAFSCMSGKERSAAEWAKLVPSGTGTKVPRVSIWQGDADWTVRPANGDQLVRQWTAVNKVSDTPTATTPIGKATRETFTDASGNVLVEHWSIAGMSHGTAVSPKEGCGTAGAFVLDVAICSTEKAAEFFGLVAGGAPNGTNAPVGAPAQGSQAGSSGSGSPSDDCN
jgi:poly(hydroxyalkanoate) depolymerase family esterase